MSSTRNRRTKVLFPVFKGYEVCVILARDLEKTGKRLAADLKDCEAAFVTHDDAPGYGWLVFPLAPPPGLISHEASHAIEALFAFAGAARDEESFAYHLEYLVGRIHKFVDRAVDIVNGTR